MFQKLIDTRQAGRGQGGKVALCKILMTWAPLGYVYLLLFFIITFTQCTAVGVFRGFWAAEVYMKSKSGSKSIENGVLL